MRVCIIPARGGSKRIPRKNMKLFLGKPIIGWSIEAAFETGIFDKIIVSTDDVEIADIARAFGAEVPFIRPAELADDHADTSSVLMHAIQWLQSESFDVEYACCLYATAPLVASSDLAEAMRICISSDVDYVFSATTFSFPIQRAFRLLSNGGCSLFFPEFEDSRSQDLEESWHDAGQFYIGPIESWLQYKPIFGSRSRPLKIPRSRVQDIDSIEDWEHAEILALANRSHRNQ